MIVGIISDTHGLLRPEAVVALKDCQLIVHAGDIGAPDVLDRLRAIAPTVAVRGNVDTGTWAQTLPLTEVVEAGHLQLCMLHDLARSTSIPNQQDLPRSSPVTPIVRSRTFGTACCT